jgi:hypothetical protein
LNILNWLQQLTIVATHVNWFQSALVLLEQYVFDIFSRLMPKLSYECFVITNWLSRYFENMCLIIITISYYNVVIIRQESRYNDIILNGLSCYMCRMLIWTAKSTCIWLSLLCHIMLQECQDGPFIARLISNVVMPRQLLWLHNNEGSNVLLTIIFIDLNQMTWNET